LEIKWSKEQVIVEPMPISAITISSTPRLTSFAMDKISTPTAAQSEAYISAIALFFVFALSPKEERCHIRLPGTWRGLWSELLALKKDYDDAEDREVLRKIKSLVQSNLTRGGTDVNVTAVPDGHQANKQTSNVVDAASMHNQTSSDLLKADWTRKASRLEYSKMLTSRSKLPIWKFKQEILDLLNKHQALIVCGETGCGKSTQIPAFILEQEMMNGRNCKIYVTEPRRISAVSLARRVSEELGERNTDIGSRQSDVGYAIRLESKVTDQTRIIYA
jgi:ATP-dependent RNA helicase DHX29